MDSNETSTTVYLNITTELMTTKHKLQDLEKNVECLYWSYFEASNSNIPLIILFSILPIFGLIVGLIGYRYLRLSLFITSFVFISVLIFVTCYEDPLELFKNFFLWTFKLPLILGLGFLFGIVSIILPHMGIIILSCLVGTILSAFFIALAPFLIISYLIWFPLGMLIIFSIFFLVMSLFFTKPCCIVALAMSGSTLIIVSLDIFLDHGAMFFFIYECYFRGEDLAPYPPTCWLPWSFYALFPILVIIFTMIQAFATAKDCEQSLSPVCVRFKNRNMNSEISVVNSRPRSVQNVTTLDDNQKQQHLYRVRHNYGDVISKSQLEAYESHRSQPSSLLLPQATIEGRLNESDNQPTLFDDVSLIYTQTEDIPE